MELQQIAQLNNPNDNNVAANTGKRGMLVEMAAPEHLIMMPKQFIIPRDTEFNLAYIEQKVQEGIFIPVLGASAFEDVSAEDSYNTNSSGVKRLNLKGLVEHRYTFEEGHEFYKQMSRLESYKSFGFAIGDDEGNWALAKNSKGDYLGFTSSHITPERRMSKQKGGENEKKSILIQFDNRRQWDFDYDLFLAEYLDFNPEEVPTINGVNTSFNSVPTVTDTTLDVNIVLSSDHSTPVEGLLATDILIVADGAADPIVDTITESTPGNYTVTLVAALANNSPLTVALDGVINQSGVMFRSNNAIAVTPA